MIDHTGIVVSDFDKSKNFYAAALAPIGLNLIAEYPAELTGLTDIAGFCESADCGFWISGGCPDRPAARIAFHVENRALVDDFYAAAIGAGGRDGGRPCLRTYFLPDYYSAFVLDPDGHHIEAFCHA